MTVKVFRPNPLNTFDLRRLDHCPPHFYSVYFDLSTNEKKVTDWIFEKLQGRFFFGDCYRESTTKYLQKQAAFEIHSEASYFAMVLNDINKF